ncbi:VC2046/SO_2500 family protein [Thalassotalea atypica]|uniref:VC2046/SO_2500 family protein n=1 Tax=Thalassotalea atypica TaxID=2054316 RepID=UPI00257344A4|nr:VC2046/SO_2500 family protein [Thalassotalea atypica]
MVKNNLLIHELQLGETLNKCIHSKRRADFSLMLAMLVEDAREFSQFKTPLTQDSTTDCTEQQLRKQFELPDKEPLSLTDFAQISHFNQASQLSEKQLFVMKLNDALSPKPLCFRDDKHFIETNIKSNTSLYCQHKLEADDEKAVRREAFNANEWLKSVKNTRVQSIIATA